MKLRDGFPHRLTDGELAAEIQRLVDGLEASTGEGDDPSRVSPNVLLPFILVGVQEQSRRSAKRSSNVALLIAILAILIAVILGVGNQVTMEGENRAVCFEQEQRETIIVCVDPEDPVNTYRLMGFDRGKFIVRP